MDHICQLYLRLGGNDLPSLERMENIIRLAAPAALLIGRQPLNALKEQAALKTLVNSVQKQNLAILIEDDIGLATELKADGVHLTGGLKALEKACSLLGDTAQIGVSSPLSRHEAMLLAEAGADYIAFGAADEANGETFDALVDMTAWWAEIIELPCVVWLDQAEEEADIRRLIEAGADYVAPEITASVTDDALIRLYRWSHSNG